MLIEIATGDMATLTAYIGDLFTDLKILIMFAIGLPVALWAIRRVISFVREGWD